MKVMEDEKYLAPGLTRQKMHEASMSSTTNLSYMTPFSDYHNQRCDTSFSVDLSKLFSIFAAYIVWRISDVVYFDRVGVCRVYDGDQRLHADMQLALSGLSVFMTTFRTVTGQQMTTCISPSLITILNLLLITLYLHILRK
jgi:hypothetical protein